MIDKLIFFVLALCALARERGAAPRTSASDAQAEADRAAERARRAQKNDELEQAAHTEPTAWPQAVPSGLPAFPSGWEYAEPVTPAVRTRAWQLLDELWKRGSGSTKVELTAGTWITYRAEITKGSKRGVVAYRPKRRASAPAPKTAPRAAAPAVTRSPGVPQVTRASSPAPTQPPVIRRTETTGKPWLRQGAGMGALVSLKPYVVEAQTRLAALKFYIGKIDGLFGPGTKAAVVKFQQSKSLQADGIVGDNTWDALDAGGGFGPSAWNVQVQPAQLAS